MPRLGEPPAPIVIDRPGVTTMIDVEAPPDTVMAWLLHAPAFPRWVVGPRRVVEVDPTWPAPGAGFTHETGRGPLRYHDRTVLREMDASAGRVTLEAMTRPVGLALVQLYVTATDGGRSHVVMHERPLGGLGAAVPAPIYRPALLQRNRLSMRRLRRLVDRHAPPRSHDT